MRSEYISMVRGWGGDESFWFGFYTYIENNRNIISVLLFSCTLHVESYSTTPQRVSHQINRYFGYYWNGLSEREQQLRDENIWLRVVEEDLGRLREVEMRECEKKASIAQETVLQQNRMTACMVEVEVSQSLLNRSRRAIQL